MSMAASKKAYDAIVVGVGAMGSSTLYHLARAGKRVLGLERFALGHDFGSSHGLTRVIRLAYCEHPSYVPLLRRAYELWDQLERESSKKLLTKTGCADMGAEDSFVFSGSLLSCKEHNLQHEVLTGDQVNARFPGFRVPSSVRCVLQPDGGFLASEECIHTYAGMAQRHGAELRTNEGVTAWEVLPSGEARVTTSKGQYTADRLVLSCGAWMSTLVPVLQPLLQPERQVVGWFATTASALYQPSRFPVFQLDVPEGRFYGFPEWGVPGLKIGLYHHRHQTVQPDVRLPVDPDDEAVLRRGLQYLPHAQGTMLTAKACMFTNTRDEHFILDLHPQYPQVVLASPCSGHGFKFASVVGEICAQLALRGDTVHDIQLHRLKRLLPVA